MKTDERLKMWLLIFDNHGEIAHATIDGAPLLFRSIYAARRAVEESRQEGIEVRPMQVKEFLRAGYSLESTGEVLDQETLKKK